MTDVEALVAAYPERFDAASAQRWLAARRDLLLARAAPTDIGAAASSGCAHSGALTHAAELADAASRALARWDAGLGPVCETCSAVLAFERLEAAPAVVRCTSCARSG